MVKYFKLYKKAYNQAHITVSFPGATITNDFLYILPGFFYDMRVYKLVHICSSFFLFTQRGKYYHI